MRRKLSKGVNGPINRAVARSLKPLFRNAILAKAGGKAFPVGLRGAVMGPAKVA
jgi:hypothetical protein